MIAVRFVEDGLLVDEPRVRARFLAFDGHDADLKDFVTLLADFANGDISWSVNAHTIDRATSGSRTRCRGSSRICASQSERCSGRGP